MVTDGMAFQIEKEKKNVHTLPASLRLQKSQGHYQNVFIQALLIFLGQGT